MTSSAGAIDGDCDPRFLKVREAFAQNLMREDETGTAVSIRVEGQRVVDLFGGYANIERKISWQADTLVNAYSTGKAVLAAQPLRLADPDADVALAICEIDSTSAGKPPAPRP